MLIVLDCPGCGKRYEVDASLAGKKSRCKQCGEVFQIPVPRAASPSPPASSKPLRPPQNTTTAGEWQTALVEPQPTARPGRAVPGAKSGSHPAGSGSKTIVLNCPNCQKRYEIDEVLAGKKSRCKDCGEVFSIPVPMGRARCESLRPPAGRVADSAPSLWESVIDDTPASLKGSRGPAAPMFDDLDLPPPPRAAYPTPSRKSYSQRDRGNNPEIGFTIAGFYVMGVIVVGVGFWIWKTAAEPTSERNGRRSFRSVRCSCMELHLSSVFRARYGY